MVLRGGDCTTWMPLAQTKQITGTIKLVATNDKFGYGIGAWGTHHLAIFDIYSHLYFPVFRMLTLNVLHVLRLKANKFLIQLV